MQVFDGSTGSVVSLCFTPDGRGLVLGSPDGVSVWDVTGPPECLRSFDSSTDFACPVAVSPCGRYLAWGGGFLRVVDLTNPRRIKALSASGALAVAFSPDGKELADPSFPPHRWAVPSWKEIRTRRTPTEPDWLGDAYLNGPIVYAPDGRSICLSLSVQTAPGRRLDAYFCLFDRRTGELTGELRTEFGHGQPTQIAFSPDGAVVAGNFGPVLGVASIADRKEVVRIKTGTKHITGLCFTPDGSKLVTVSNDSRVRVFDARTWTETTGYEWKIGGLRSVAVAPDGLRMAAGSDRGKVVIWDVDE